MKIKTILWLIFKIIKKKFVQNNLTEKDLIKSRKIEEKNLNDTQEIKISEL